MYWCPYFYNCNMNELNRYYQMNNELSFVEKMRPSLDANTNLVLDSQNYKDIPNHFRRTNSSLATLNNNNLNLSGLNKLNISGSQQFSEYNLPLVVNSIGTTLPITVIDLRQESHGFINGAPVSWANARNDANIGLTLDQVLLDEYNKLNNIPLNASMTYYNHKNITVIPTKVENEYHLVNSKMLLYIRITVTDGKIPTDNMVDYFVKLIKSQQGNTWLHFHCKQGIGRTTTFMIMYDMIKNAKDVTADDIIKRQLLLSDFNESHIESFNNNERINFLQNFYKYCRSNSND